MSGVRRHLTLVALVWLLSHVTTVGVSLAGLCCNAASAASASVSDEDACCEGLAPGQMCPLHKHRAHQSERRTQSPPSPGDCAMRSSCDPAAMTLTALSLGIGLLPEPVVVSDAATAARVSVDIASPLERSVLPDFPPPRA